MVKNFILKPTSALFSLIFSFLVVKYQPNQTKEQKETRDIKKEYEQQHVSLCPTR